VPRTGPRIADLRSDEHIIGDVHIRTFSAGEIVSAKNVIGYASSASSSAFASLRSGVSKPSVIAGLQGLADLRTPAGRRVEVLKVSRDTHTDEEGVAAFEQAVAEGGPRRRGHCVRHDQGAAEIAEEQPLHEKDEHYAEDHVVQYSARRDIDEVQIKAAASSAGGWRLEEWAADLLLTCREGRPYDSPDETIVRRMLERRSGPIGAVIAVHIELPDDGPS
jgi:hypothetical protein